MKEICSSCLRCVRRLGSSRPLVAGTSISRRGISTDSRPSPPQPVAIGQLRSKRDIYSPGDLLIHGTFGYRGVVLSSWEAFSVDHFGKTATSDPRSVAEKDTRDRQRPVYDAIRSATELFSPKRFYSVLVDERDYDRATERIHGLSNTAMPVEHSKSPKLKSPPPIEASFATVIPGLDVVEHDEVLPFAALCPDGHAFRHSLVGEGNLLNSTEAEFLDGEKIYAHLTPSSDLDTWKTKNCTWLESATNHRQKSFNVSVSMMPSYRGTSAVHLTSSSVPSSSQKLYWWRYTCRVENHLLEPVMLSEYSLSLVTTMGGMTSMRGRGIPGTSPQWVPTLQPASSGRRAASVQFTDWVRLEARNSILCGTLHLETADGLGFSCPIPACPLRAQN